MQRAGNSLQAKVFGRQPVLSCLCHPVSQTQSSESHIRKPSLLGARVASYCHPVAIFLIRKYLMVPRDIRFNPLCLMTSV